MQPEERWLIATAVPNTTLLVGPLCNTSVVATVRECNQSAPLVSALGTGSSPERLVYCWGDGVEKAIVSACTATVSTMRSLGLTPPKDLDSSAIHHLLLVDRSDAMGKLLNHQPVSLVVPAEVAGNLSVLVYPGGDTVSKDLLSIGGFVSSIPGGFLLASPHTSAFVTYQPTSPATGTADNGWWIGLAAGLGSAAGLLLLAVPIIWLAYRRRRAAKREARTFETYAPGPVLGEPYLRQCSAASNECTAATRDPWPCTVIYHDGIFLRCSARGDVYDDDFFAEPPPTPMEHSV
eukprot:EG_transcript_1517